MSDIAISVSSLSKLYRLAHKRTQPSTFREFVATSLMAPFRRLRSLRAGMESESEDFWALRDVTFDVKAGSVCGIIGRNGAGKSTLLKILSRIVTPTAGTATLRGRVASLLEVGTGFHPELTGRENIFLNGAILGMKRREIRAKFDEIVAFAGVERFLDTPVKRYSSGMYVRLAFAVSAHLEPDILIVDEVLAVGDAEFQKKCIGKMQDVANNKGRTVLFVSHNMQAMRTLCTEAVVMSAGRTQFAGDIASAIDQYLATTGSEHSPTWVRQSEDGLPANPRMWFASASCTLEGEQPDHRLRIHATLHGTPGSRPAFAAVDILDASGAAIMQALPTLDTVIRSGQHGGDLTITIQLPPLVPGIYGVTLWCGPHNSETYDLQRGILGFEVTTSPTSGRTFPHTPDHGHVVPPSQLTFTARSSVSPGVAP